MRRLLHTNINCAGHVSQLLRELSCDLMVGRQIAAQNLNVERRRQSEVNCLGYDVRRQEIELSAWKLLVQIEAQLTHVFGSRLVVCLEPNENVRVG